MRNPASPDTSSATLASVGKVSQSSTLTIPCRKDWSDITASTLYARKNSLVHKLLSEKIEGSFLYEYHYQLYFSYPEELSPFVAEVNGRTILLEVEITRSMLDGKMRSIISGRGGAYCPHCDCTAATYFKRCTAYYDPYVSFML